MSRVRKVVLASGVLAAAAGAALLAWFLSDQGLDRAGLWVTVLSFGLTAVGTAATVWTLLVAVRSAQPKSRRVASGEVTQVLIGPLETSYGYGMTAITKSGNDTPRVIHAGAGEASLKFDITSQSDMDIRIDGVYLHVLEFLPVYFLESMASLGIAEMRRYTCTIEPAPGIYECRQTSQDYDFIKLSPGELERFGVSVAAHEAGVCQIAVGVRYSIGGKLKSVESNKLVTFGFFGEEQSTLRSRDGKLRLKQTVERALLEALRDSDPSNRHAAAMQLGRFKVSAAIPELTKLLGDDSADVRARSVKLLGGYSIEPHIIETLSVAMADTNTMVSREAAEALGNTRNPAVIPALEKALTRSDLTHDAAEALGRIGIRSLPVLKRAIESPISRVRAEVTSALAMIGGAEALELISEALNDADKTVRERAVRALGKIRGKIAMARLVDALHDSVAEVSELAAFELMGIRDRSTIPQLREALARGNSQAGRALGAFDPPDIEGLIVALKHRNWKVRQGAVIGLEVATSQLHTPGVGRLHKSDPQAFAHAIASLREATQDKHSEVRRRAKLALSYAQRREAGKNPYL